jgi:hypothetical protein
MGPGRRTRNGREVPKVVRSTGGRMEVGQFEGYKV